MTLSPNYKFHEDGIAHLKGRSAILADDPGLGKTRQAIVAHKDDKWPILVITTLRNKLFWAQSILAWASSDEDVEVAETAGRFDKDFLERKGVDGRKWLIVHWQALQRRSAAEVFRAVPWGAVIVDEAHRMKDRNTKQGAFLTFTLRAGIWTFLTATPMEKSPADMWPLLHRCNPERYKSYWSFVARWVKTKDIYVGPEQRKVTLLLGCTDPQGFAREIAPYYLRRTKAVVAPWVPAVLSLTIPLNLNGMAKKYAEFEKETLVDTPAEELYQPTKLAKLVRLQQYISWPGIFGFQDVSPKAEWLLDYVNDHPDDPILVYFRFREPALELAKKLPKAMAVVGGNTEWRGWASNINIVLATYGTLNDSVNLDKTNDGRAVSTVVYYDYHWSHIVNEQAVNRVHRVTTALPVTHYTLHMTGSIDDDIAEALIRKAADNGVVSNFLRRLGHVR
jgi:hypothetical protein